VCETVAKMREQLAGNLVAATDDLVSVPHEPV
jgi:hypothetical protein